MLYISIPFVYHATRLPCNINASNLQGPNESVENDWLDRAQWEVLYRHPITCHKWLYWIGTWLPWPQTSYLSMLRLGTPINSCWSTHYLKWQLSQIWFPGNWCENYHFKETSFHTAFVGHSSGQKPETNWQNLPFWAKCWFSSTLLAFSLVVVEWWLNDGLFRFFSYPHHICVWYSWQMR